MTTHPDMCFYFAGCALIGLVSALVIDDALVGVFVTLVVCFVFALVMIARDRI